MSTYLLAFVIGKFDYIELETNGGVKIRSYTNKGESDYSYEHLKIAVEAIEMFEEFFEIKYPLPKLDLVAFHEMS
jgi:puromycin-sensitive aminopeptidase